MLTINIETIQIGDFCYQYSFTDIYNGLKAISKIDTDKILVYYDNKIDKKCINKLINGIKDINKVVVLSVEVHESMKTIASLTYLIDFAIDNNLTNNSTIIAIGGGVLNDIAGLAAGMLYRGIKLVNIPTTIIAAADSTISLKQAVNSSKSKNGIGLFYTPYSVLTIKELFDSLPEREYKAGLTESVKNLLGISPETIPLFQKYFINGPQFTYDEIGFIIKTSISDKMKVIKNDIKEDKEGLILEYGHGIGHAIEMCTKGKVNHGEAVAFGMLVMSSLSHEMGYLSTDEVDIHKTLLNQIGIMDSLKCIKSISVSDILAYLRFDNKRGYLCTTESQYPMVILEKLGKSVKKDGKGIILVEEDILIENVEKSKKILTI